MAGLMGTFSITLEIGDFAGTRFEQVDAIVDSGATYTAIPSNTLRRLGITPQEDAEFVLANGQKVMYGLAWIRVRLAGREQPTLVIFGDQGSEILLGAFTLEGFRLGVDAVNKRLVPTPGLLVGLKQTEF
jgi:predicted aspartyl protease